MAVCMFLCIDEYMNMCIVVYVNTCICVCMFLCICVCMYTCIIVYNYTIVVFSCFVTLQNRNADQRRTGRTKKRIRIILIFKNRRVGTFENMFGYWMLKNRGVYHWATGGGGLQLKTFLTRTNPPYEVYLFLNTQYIVRNIFFTQTTKKQSILPINILLRPINKH